MKRENDIAQQLDIAENTFRRSRLRHVATCARAPAGGDGPSHFCTVAPRPASTWGYLEAFAEAAIVGAVADWFATADRAC
jgi:uncharacterized membrane-anchored protein YjiN (DUF445 family)